MVCYLSSEKFHICNGFLWPIMASIEAVAEHYGQLCCLKICVSKSFKWILKFFLISLKIFTSVSQFQYSVQTVKSKKKKKKKEERKINK